MLDIYTESGIFTYECPLLRENELKGHYVIGLLQDFPVIGAARILRYESNLFNSLLSGLDFLYNYWFVFIETRKMNRGLQLVHQFSIHSFLSPLMDFMRISTRDLIEVYKWLTTYPLASVRALHKGPNPLPKAPVIYDRISGRRCIMTEILPWYVFKNNMGRRFSAIIKGRASNETISFANNLFQTKRGCPAVPPSFVQDALHKHQDALSNPYKPPTSKSPAPDIISDEEYLQVVGPPRINLPFVGPEDRGELSRDEFLNKLPRMLDFILPAIVSRGDRLDGRRIWKKLYPASNSACYEYKTNEGGARQYIKETILEDLNFHIKYDQFYLPLSIPSLYKMYSVRVGKAKSVYSTISFRDSEIFDFLFEKVLDEHLDLEACVALGELSLDSFHCKVKEIIEPLKVRMITKSEAIPQYLSIPVQKAMHSSLRKRKIFRLIGEPLTGAIIDDFISMTSRKGAVFRSGDYKGATDGLDQDITRIVGAQFIRELIPNLSDIKVSLLMNNLIQQRIHYDFTRPDGTIVHDECFQANGQLMGSILSFPILCLVNYLTYFVSLSPLYKEFILYEQGLRRPLSASELDSEALLVNGDDILFEAPDEKYSSWVNNLKFFGFQLSLGKNLCSERFMTINSTLFVKGQQVVSSADKMFFQCARYSNVGLLKGRSKVCSTDLIDDKPLWSISSEIEGGFTTPDFPHHYTLWNKQRLNRYSEDGRRNYFGPRELGMCGLYNPDAKFTDPQRAWASCTLNSLKEFKEHSLRPTGLVSEGGLVSGIMDSWNDCRSRQPNLGKYIPRLQPDPPGFTSIMPKRHEVQFHPFEGVAAEDKRVVFSHGSGAPKVFLPESKWISGKRILSLTDGFKFVRKNQSQKKEEYLSLNGSQVIDLKSITDVGQGIPTYAVDEDFLSLFNIL
jgi:hypothetical protein